MSRAINFGGGMKVFIKFFLSLCLFLWGGDSCLYAHASPGTARYPPSKKSVIAQYSNAHVRHQNIASVKPEPCSKEKVNDKSVNPDNEDDDDDDKLTTGRKAHELQNYFTAFYCARAPGHFSFYRKKRLPLSHYIPYSSSNRYIVFCVIRI